MKNHSIKIALLLIILILLVRFAFLIEFNMLLRSLIIVMSIDYVLGVGLGILGKSKHGDGEISSKVGFKGLLKKLTSLLLVGVSFLTTFYLAEYNIDFKYAVDIVITAFFINELVSILENAKLLGVNIPDFFDRALDFLNNNNKKDKK